MKINFSKRKTTVLQIHLVPNWKLFQPVERQDTWNNQQQDEKISE